MTLIVGTLCTDGVVLASDGAATLTTPFGGASTAIHSTRKLFNVDDRAIFGASGDVGIGQLLRESFRLGTQPKHADPFAKNSIEARKKIRNLFATVIHDEEEHSKKLPLPIQQHPSTVNRLVYSALTAFTLGNEPYLVEFDVNADIVIEPTLVCTAIGSGQPHADPFLNFIKRGMWHGKVPSFQEATFGLIWVLHHVCLTMPSGGVAPPFQVMSLINKDGNCTIQEMDDHALSELKQDVSEAEGKVSELLRTRAKQTESVMVQDPPAAPVLTAPTVI